MNPLSFIPPGLQVWARIAALILLVLAGACVGWIVNGWRLGTDLQALKAEHLQTVADAAKASEAAQAKALADHQRLAGQMAAVSHTYLTDMEEKTRENENLRAAVAAGRRVVRIAATCPASSGGVSEAAAGGRVDPAAGAVLDPEAGQAVLDLRADAIRIDRKLAACQQALGCLTDQRSCAPAAPSTN